MAKDERFVLVPLDLWTKIFDLVQDQPLKNVIELHKNIETAQLQVVDLSAQRNQQQENQGPIAGAAADKQKRGPKKQQEVKAEPDPNKPKRGRKPKAVAVQMTLDTSQDQEQEVQEPEYTETE